MESDISKVNERVLNSEPPHVRWIIAGGWLSLVLSAVFLSVSTDYILSAESDEMSTLIYLSAARIFGIGGFLAGVVAIFNQRWTTGAILLIGSVVLPFVSLFVHGSI